jgi:putative transposase
MDTLYRWRRKYSGVTRAEAQRLDALEEENRWLKRLVAEQALNVQVLKDALGESGDDRLAPRSRRVTRRGAL